MPTSIYRSAGMAFHTADGAGIALPSDATVRRVAREWWVCLLAGSTRRIAIYVPRVAGGEAFAAFFGTVEDKILLRDWFRSEGGKSAAPGSLWGRRAESRIGDALRYWPTWSCRGLRRVVDDRGNPSSENFNEERVTINPRGQLPATMLAGTAVYLDKDGNLEANPVDAQYRIDLVRRPTISTTLAGHALPSVLDAEEDDET